MRHALLLGALLLSILWGVSPSFARIDVEHYYPSGGASRSADALLKTGRGFLHTITCASDAAATAGTLAIRDGVAAGGGTIILQLEFVAAYFPPVTLVIDQEFTTGLFLDFTTTADVNCATSFR